MGPASDAEAVWREPQLEHRCRETLKITNQQDGNGHRPAGTLLGIRLQLAITELSWKKKRTGSATKWKSVNRQSGPSLRFTETRMREPSWPLTIHWCQYSRLSFLILSLRSGTAGSRFEES